MFGKSDALDRLVQGLLGLAALAAFTNGSFMLVDPFGWYDFVGTVKASGPPNGHFIRDIAIAFILSGLVLAYAGLNPALRWGSAIVGGLFPAFHGLLHIYEVTTGICSPDIFWQDAPGVLGPPTLIIIAIAIQLGRQRISPVPLPKGLFLRAASGIAGEDSAYLDDIANAGGFATECFQHFMVLSGHRYHAPADLMLMTMLGSTRTEDCGPCVEIVRRYALSAGIDPARIDDALMGKAGSEADALAFDFGAAIASGEIATAAQLGERIDERFGRRVRTELSLAAASSRVFPAIKRGLGHASPCSIARAA